MAALTRDVRSVLEPNTGSRIRVSFRSVRMGWSGLWWHAGSGEWTGELVYRRRGQGEDGRGRGAHQLFRSPGGFCCSRATLAGTA